MSKWTLAAASIVAGALLTGCVCWAHKPATIGGTFDGPSAAVALQQPGVSQVVYGDIPVERPSLWVAVDGTAGLDLYVQLGVPAIERLRAFRPQMAVVGPGLPRAELPFSAPPGLGAVLVVTSSVADGERLHEPVTDTESWVLGEARVHLSVPGTYYVVVWSSSIQDGKVWVAVGEREAFGLGDLLRLPRTIEAVRAFHEVGRDPRLVSLAKVFFLAGAAVLISFLTRL